METQVYTYWIEITGKAPRKRNPEKWCIAIGHCEIDAELSIDGSKERAQELVNEHGLRDAHYRVKRTEDTRCEYDNGMVTFLRPIFDVNLHILDGKELLDAPRKRK